MPAACPGSATAAMTCGGAATASALWRRAMLRALPGRRLTLSARRAAIGRRPLARAVAAHALEALRPLPRGLRADLRAPVRAMTDGAAIGVAAGAPFGSRAATPVGDIRSAAWTTGRAPVVEIRSAAWTSRRAAVAQVRAAT